MNTVDVNEMFDEVNVKHQFWDLKKKWREQTSAMYPGASYPEMAWLFEQVGIDPRAVCQEPITKKTYKTFLLDDDGKRVMNGAGDGYLVVTRKFDSEQQKIVREWWPMLPEDMAY